jgi:signal transduction histidine kinase
MRAPTLRLSAAVIAHTCRRIEPGHLSRERVRSVLRVADELLRVACFFDVVKTRAAVVQMDLTLRALRDFITSEVRVPEKRRVLGADHLIQEAVKQLGDFARASNVEIDWQRRGSDLTVMGNERDLLRAVCNILHNALKYSWRRDKGASPWVAIRVVEVEEESFVDLEFENWGVPITQSEINEGLLFQMGYRGKWSTDRGRLGTGIGLTDSQRVALGHGGDLRVESRPVHSTSLVPGDREYYERPFLTKVVLRLPLAG